MNQPKCANSDRLAPSVQHHLEGMPVGGNELTPHGGKLVDRFIANDENRDYVSELSLMPVLTLDSRELADLELIATGAASPLEGFLGSADYRSVLERMRLADGTIWPLPLTLAIGGEEADRLTPGRLIALRDETGRLWGGMRVRELYERDALVEARAVYRTDDPSHPGVAYLRNRPTLLVAGP